VGSVETARHHLAGLSDGGEAGTLLAIPQLQRPTARSDGGDK